MENHKFKIVLDTNILLTSISRKSPYHWIYQKIIKEEIILCFSNEILTEYEEILDKKMPSIKNNIIDIILYSKNTIKIITYFRWNLVTNDPDDNKFADCAIACNADYIISNDKHFNCLNKISFPKINVINPDEFKKLFK